MPLSAASDAACIASPRVLTMRRPSSKLMAPAKLSAVYSPASQRGA